MSSESSGKHWLPLESNPDVMNKFIHSLGFSSDFGFCDIYGTDPDLLTFLPQPILAVLLLYPITPNSEKARAELEDALNRKDASGEVETDPSVYFMKQTIGNACGTIGILHAATNNADHVPLVPEGYLVQLLDKTREMTPEQRAQWLQDDMEIEKLHSALSHEGQSSVPQPSDEVDLHFVCFVHANGNLYELDGRRSRPIRRGPSSAATLLFDAVKVIKEEYMAKDPDEIRFTMVALAPSDA